MLFLHSRRPAILAVLASGLLVGCGNSEQTAEQKATTPSVSTEAPSQVVPWSPPTQEPRKLGSLAMRTPGGGNLSVVPAVYDFGDVGAGMTYPAKFQLVNSGTGPVTLVSASPSCTCTTITDVAGKSIPPGGSMELEAALAAPKQPGSKAAKVFLRTEGVAQPMILEIKGNVTLAIRATPPFAKALDDVTEGTIRLSAIDGKPFTVLSSNGETPRFVNHDPANDPPQAEYEVKWSIFNMPCELIPRWWVIETDRADCPLIPCRVQNQCTGSKRDMNRILRHWIFDDYLLDAGAVRRGVPFTLVTDLEYYNPRGGGTLQKKDWAQGLSVESAIPGVKVEVVGSEALSDMSLRVELSVVLDETVPPGLLYAPVTLYTATGNGVVDVIAKVNP
jgi:hypothetical protein